MTAYLPSSLSRSQVLAAVVALAFGAGAVMLAADGSGGDASVRSLPSQAALPLPPPQPVVVASPAAPAPAGLHASVGTAVVTEPPVAVEDPLDGLILDAVDPAEALFGDEPQVATTN